LRPSTRRRAYLGRVLSIAEYSGTGGSSLIGSLNSAKPLIAKHFALAAHPAQQHGPHSRECVAPTHNKQQGLRNEFYSPVETSQQHGPHSREVHRAHIMGNKSQHYIMLLT
jgi:hypothetical protein